MKHFVHLAGGLALMSLAACASSPVNLGSDPDATQRFERMKSLAGNWVTVQEEGTQPAGQEVRYRVTSNGNAVVESLFPGTTHEMLSVYHLERGDLVITHYCALGNRPQMRSAPATDAARMLFRCDGSADLDCSSELHMHEGVFRLVDDTHLRAAWTLYEHGRPAEVVKLALVRSWQ
jgi:hypothetical protein